MNHIEHLSIFHNKNKVGELFLGEKGKILFSYDPQWIKEGFNISPFDLVMTTNLQQAKDNLFSGLHGIFADSISDGWGLMLTDRALQKKFQWEKKTITQLDRLFFIGSRAMGGLNYVPNQLFKNSDNIFNIETIFNETQHIMKGEKEEIIKELYLSGGSPGGARPKAVFAKNGDEYISGYDFIPKGFSGWIIKFFSEHDSNSIGKIEKSYSDMAKDCDIVMPKTELITTKIKNKIYSFFAIERFDRNNNEKIHVASLSGLVYASHRIPSISYEDIFGITNVLCKNHKQLERLTDIMLFNIITNNQDDHSKNFSYRYINNQWELSPSYDLVYSIGPGNEHMSAVYGNGNPNYKDIKRIADNFDIKNINEKIEKISDVANKWEKYANRYDIPKSEINDIKKSLQENLKRINNLNIKSPKNKS